MPHIDPNGRFIVAAMQNPGGMKPGLYFYVLHLTTGRKVSRYLRKPASAYRKANRYEAMYAQGDRYWPEVGRCDELRDSLDVVPTFLERALAYMEDVPVRFLCEV